MSVNFVQRAAPIVTLQATRRERQIVNGVFLLLLLLLLLGKMRPEPVLSLRGGIRGKETGKGVN